MMSNYHDMKHNVYGHDHSEPVFEAESKSWGHIPAMRGYKNYEHYMAY